MYAENQIRGYDGQVGTLGTVKNAQQYAVEAPRTPEVHQAISELGMMIERLEKASAYICSKVTPVVCPRPVAGQDKVGSNSSGGTQIGSAIAQLTSRVRVLCQDIEQTADSIEL